MENGVCSVFSSVEKLSSAGYLLRVIGVAVLLYLASRFLPRRSGGQFSSYDFAFFWMMGGLVAAPLFDSKISFAYVLVSVGTILYPTSWLKIALWPASLEVQQFHWSWAGR